MRGRIIDPKSHRVTEHGSVISFLQTGRTPPGINTVIDGGVPIDFLNVPADSDLTIFFFHGAMENTVRLPVLSGQGISAGLKANRVFVSDPSLVLHDKLGLAWYAGNHAQSQLQDRLVSIFEKIVADHVASRVVFFGGSGGGFASMYFASRIPNSLALVFNPQTNLARYNSAAVHAFTQRAFQIDSYEYDPLHLLPETVTTNLVPVYANRVNTKVAYMQNLRDQSHILRQLRPFCDSLHPSNDVDILVQAWNDGHTPPPKPLLANALQRLSRTHDWDSALSACGFRSLTPALAADIAANGLDRELATVLES